MRIVTHVPLLLFTLTNSLPLRSNGSELSLVKDINVTPNVAPLASSSNPSHFCLSGSSVFFSATAPGYGRELWKSDGTEAGTIQVKDVYPGSLGSYPEALTAVGGNVFFTANDGSHPGDALWRSDGTEAGTVLLKVLSFTEGLYDEAKMTTVGDTLFFEASDGIHGYELWKSDGTSAGTVMVKELSPGQNPRSLHNLTAVGGTLFFTANHPTYGDQLWKSDGTAAGTVVVKTFWANNPSNFIQNLKAMGNTLFFSGWDNVNGRELWKSDGTAGGTVMVKDIRLVGSADPSNLTVCGDTLFFRVTTGLYQYRLWRSDGTAEGTVVVSEVPSSPEKLTAVGNMLYFCAYTEANGTELWKTDGTEAGTVLVRDTVQGTSSSNFDLLTAVGDSLYFTTSTFQNAPLWRSDGTEAGTALVANVSLPARTNNPLPMLAVGNKLFLCATDPLGTDFELWKSDGTTGDTTLLKDIKSSNGSSVVQSLTPLGDTLFFSAIPDSINGYGLWKSDGTEAGTSLVKVVNPGNSTDKPDLLTAVGSTLYFRANTNLSGIELWKSDGTEAGTVLVKDIVPGATGSSLNSLTAVGGILYFVANDGISGTELWKSDGTETGTVLVKDISPGSGSSSPLYLTAWGDTLYFVANDGTRGSELWKTDGTPAGTVMVLDIQPNSASSSPAYLTVAGDMLYFRAFSSDSGTKLWKSDGSAAGTKRVQVMTPGLAASDPAFLTAVGSTLFFTAYGTEVWKVDETLGGALLVTDFRRLGFSTSCHSLLGVRDRLYLVANDGTHGHELWVSDGTADSTVLVKDIRVGNSSASSFPSKMTALGDILYFMADDGIHASELWRSDGTSAGTYRVSRFVGNNESSYQPSVVATQTRLFFTGFDEIIGGELWSYLPSPDVALVSGTPAVYSMNLTGEVKPNGFLTTAWVEYGTSLSYGSSASITMSPFDYFALTQTVSARLVGLTPNTLYHYRITASNIAGITSSTSGTFTTQVGPEVEVRGLEAVIAPGDNTPSFSDGTNFGDTSLLNTQSTRRFTIHNIGSDELHLTGGSKVTLSGSAASDFQVTVQPDSLVPVGGTTSFDIRFDPKLPGLRVATVTLASNDPDSPHSFTISGFGQLSKTHSQTISFTPPGVLYAAQFPYELSAYSTSGLPVSFELVSGNATLKGNVITSAQPGVIRLRATQSGSGNFAAAPSVTRFIRIGTYPGFDFTNLRQTYTGTPRPVGVIGSVSNEPLVYEVNGRVQTTPPTQAGTYLVASHQDVAIYIGVLVIEKAPLFVKVQNKRKFAGQPNPPLSVSQDVTYTGFVNGENIRALGSWPVLRTSATAKSPGGTYPITASGATAANYRIIYHHGTMTVESFASGYEALLFDEADALFGKLALTVAATNKSFTGKLLTADEVGALALKGDLLSDIGNEQATGSATVTRNGIPYTVNFTLPLTGSFSASLTRDAQLQGSTSNGQRLLKLSSKQNAAYRGAHTVHLQPPTPVGASVPAGAGWATASISSDGRMTLVGKLPDGVAFSSTLSPDIKPDPTYRWFAQPYLPARTESFIGGYFVLVPHPDLLGRRYVIETPMTWVKAPRTTDKSYRDGFGPVSTLLTLDPWLPTASGIPLLQRLGLSGSFDIGHSPTNSAMDGDLPTVATLSTTNKATVSLPASNPTKWKVLTLSPANGKFTGSFELNDNSDKRSVPFSGVLRQPASTSPDAVIGSGHYQLPALPDALSDENTTGELLLERPIP